MTPLTEDLVRREVGKLLRVDYRGQILCFSCLVTFVRDSFGTTYTKGQIERALRAVSKSPRALTYTPSFICDRCGKTSKEGRVGPEAQSPIAKGRLIQSRHVLG